MMPATPSNISKTHSILVQWLDQSANDHTLRRPVIYLLIKLASFSHQLPDSLYVAGVDIGALRDPCCWGGFADVYKGIYESNQVAIKKLKVAELGREREEIHRVSRHI